MNHATDAWVFAYGSNMDLEDLRRWFGERGHDANGIQAAECAVLPGYRLVWNYYSPGRRGGAANIEPQIGHELPGVALKVDAAALGAIDAKEGHPRYYSRGDRKMPIRLRDSGEVEAWVYIALPERCSATPVRPRRNYLGLMIAAAERYHFPDWYLNELGATPTAD